MTFSSHWALPHTRERAGLLHRGHADARPSGLGAIAQFDKASLLAKLKAARDRKRLATGKCGGRQSYLEARPDVVALAKQLQAGGMSLRKISVELAPQGHLTGGGKPYVASAVQVMLAT
jgi:hypothetical protein